MVCVYGSRCVATQLLPYTHTIHEYKPKMNIYILYISIHVEGVVEMCGCFHTRGGGLGSRPKKMYGERLGDRVEYHSMRPTPRH